MFWPPLLPDLLLLLLLLLCRRRYYCCCCCCAVTRSCVRSKKHNEKQSVETGCAPRCIAGREAAAAKAAEQQQHSSSTAAAAAAAAAAVAAAVAAAREQQRPAPLRSLGLAAVLRLHCRACVCSFCVCASWWSLVALVARFRPRDTSSGKFQAVFCKVRSI